MTYRATFLAWTVLALALGVEASGAAGKPQDFVDRAVIAGLYEVQAAQTIVDKGKEADARAYAERMLEHHGKANGELASLANQHELMVPSKLDAKHQALIVRLSRLVSPELEREYAAQQVEAHREAIALFDAQAKTGSDPELKAWAKAKLEMLHAHLAEAEHLPTSSAAGN